MRLKPLLTRPRSSLELRGLNPTEGGDMNFCFGERRLISLPTDYPLLFSSLTRVRSFARLLGDFRSIVHFSSLTAGTSPKFSVRGLQSESSCCLLVRSFRYYMLFLGNYRV